MGGGGSVGNVIRTVAAAATGGTTELIAKADKKAEKRLQKATGSDPGGGKLAQIQGAVSTGGGTIAVEKGKQVKAGLKELEDAQNAANERQEKLFAAQQAAIREDRAREDRTRRRAKAQARKRLALGFLAGKQGTVKTGALGLQNPAQVASRQVGVV